MVFQNKIRFKTVAQFIDIFFYFFKHDFWEIISFSVDFYAVSKKKKSISVSNASQKTVDIIRNV